MSVTAPPLALGRGARRGRSALLAAVSRRPWPEVACLIWAAAMLGVKLKSSYTPLSFALDPLTGLSLLAGGAWARTQRADTRIGNILLIASAAWFAEDFRTLETPPLAATLGALFASASLPALAWLALAFPDGRLQGRTERVVLVACALVAGPLGLLGNILIAGVPDGAAAQHLWPVDYVSVSSGIDGVIDSAMLVAGSACAVLIAFLVARRFARSARPTRRFAMPFVSVALVLASVIVIHEISLLADDPVGFDEPLLTVEQTLTVALALAFPLGLLRLRLARGGLSRMLTGLAGSDLQLREALAGAFDDPELELVLWDERTSGWTDEEGHPVAAPEAGPGRAVIELQRADHRAGAVVTDQTWTLDDDLVRAVGVATSLELDNARLVQGRRALVDAADAELRRLERDLHDGAQQQLVAVTLHLAEIENGLRAGDDAGAPDRLATARADLHRAIGEVRALSAGGLPAELEDFGLGAAVGSLSSRSAIPLTLQVDLPVRPSREAEVTAWFVICEALANAGKHSAATHLGVAVTRRGDLLTVEVTDDGRGGADPRGRGLRALAERVASAGGELAIEGRPGGGTIVRASLPHGI